MNVLFPIICLLAVGTMRAQVADHKQEFINRPALGAYIQQALPSIIVLPEGERYNATGILANYHQPFFRTRKNVNLGIDLTPQFWISYAHITSVEFGLNASLNINFQIRKRSLLSFHAGSGFHYFGMHTTQQAQGFIFSDNFFATYKRSVHARNGKEYAIGFNAGFRHMSNLRIKQPSGGIENLIVGLYFERIF